MTGTDYALGTSLTANEGWYGGWRTARALCADGKVRAVRFSNGGHADTFFSVPGSVKVNGRTVTGFVSVSTVDGYDTPTADDPAVVRFTAYRYGKNANLLGEDGTQ